MASQPIVPQPGDVADEQGRFAPIEQPGDEAMAADTGIDEAGIHGEFSDTTPTRRTRTQGAKIEDLADPDADANFPDPSRPVAMGAGPGAGGRIPGGGYGDSRDTDERGTTAIDDEAPGGTPGAETDVPSGSHVTEDDTKGGSPGSVPGAEHPTVGQPANVSRPRQP